MQVIKKIASRMKLFAKRLTQTKESMRSVQDYRLSKERIAILSEIAADGARAESVLYFADEMLADVQDYVLEHVQKADINQQELSCFYRAAIWYRDKVQQAVQDGQKSSARIAEVKRSDK